MSIIFLSTLNTMLLFYTDPGSGALLLQIITATLLGGLFYFRKLKDWFSRKKDSQIETDSGKLKPKKPVEVTE